MSRRQLSDSVTTRKPVDHRLRPDTTKADALWTKRKISAVISDTVGTLVAEQGHETTALHQVAREFGFQYSRAHILQLQGRCGRKRDVFAALFSQQQEKGRGVEMTERVQFQVEEAARRFYERVHGLYLERPARPSPGTALLLRHLRQRGIPFALTSGFDRPTLNLIIDQLGWSGRLQASVSSDEVAHGRPAPDLILKAMHQMGISDPRKVAYMGDTPADLMSGHAAGVSLLVGITSGSHSHQALHAHPHHFLFKHVSSMVDLLGGGKCRISRESVC